MPPVGGNNAPRYRNCEQFADYGVLSCPFVGLGILFTKLQQGAVENRQVLTIARMRAEAEETYGQRLSEIAPAVDKMQGGFAGDDGASTRKVGEASSRRHHS